MRQVDDVLGVVRVIRDLPILAPWDEAASAVAAGLPCVAADHVVRTGSEITVGYDLDPLTDYLLDVHSVPLSGTGERHRVFRANFTTSRFTDLAHLASWILPTVPEHRLVRDRAPLDALGLRPGGNAWDDAVQRAGLPVPAVPSAPRVEIWWSAEAVPQPVAVVVECSESLLRERTTPVVCRPPGDTSDPTHTWWGTGLRPWLELAARATPDAGDATPSGPLVVGPGGTRALVRLAPGARGRRLRLDLVRHPDLLGGAAGSRELAVDVLLARAPWEVED